MHKLSMELYHICIKNIHNHYKNNNKNVLDFNISPDTYWLLFYVYSQDNLEWLELPTPTILAPVYRGYAFGYAIEGFFATDKNKAFLNDISERIRKTILNAGAYEIKRIYFNPFTQISINSILFKYKIYNLRDDLNPYLESLTKKYQEKEKNKEYQEKVFAFFGNETDDAVFDFMRFKAYAFVNENGKEAFTYDYMEKIGELAYDIIGSKKGWSTIKAKAKSIYNWVIENYEPPRWNYQRKTKDDKELLMTRRENIIKINKLRAIDKKKKVEQAIESLKFLNERISVRKVAEYAKISTKTAQKYLKELKEEGLI